jgi:hypothetical protein
VATEANTLADTYKAQWAMGATVRGMASRESGLTWMQTSVGFDADTNAGYLVEDGVATIISRKVEPAYGHAFGQVRITLQITDLGRQVASLLS